MTTNKRGKRLKRAGHRVKNALKRPFSPITRTFSQWAKSLRVGATKPQVFAYQLIGVRATRFMPLFKDLDVNLKKSRIKINFKAYVSTLILTSLLLFTSIMIFVPVLLFFILKLSLFLSLFFGLGASSPVHRRVYVDFGWGRCTSGLYMAFLGPS